MIGEHVTRKASKLGPPDNYCGPVDMAEAKCMIVKIVVYKRNRDSSSAEP